MQAWGNKRAVKPRLWGITYENRATEVSGALIRVGYCIASSLPLNCNSLWYIQG
jgi:hypothetical protein